MHNEDAAALLPPTLVETGAIELITRGEFDIQIATAKKFPRNVRTCIDEMTSLATLNADTARATFYAIPRDGKVIDGPSARMAEIALCAWRNVWGGARVVNVDATAVTAQGIFWDLERNVRVTYEVRRRITTKSGQRYGEDMVNVTANAACSIALRNAVFKGIPRAFWQAPYDAARKVAAGDSKTLAERRAKMVATFAEMKVPADRVCRAVSRQSVEEITLDDMATLIGIHNAIRDGEISATVAFPDPKAPKPSAGVAASVNEGLADGAVPDGAPAIGSMLEVNKAGETWFGTVEGYGATGVANVRREDTGKVSLVDLSGIPGAPTWREVKAPGDTGTPKGNAPEYDAPPATAPAPEPAPAAPGFKLDPTPPPFTPPPEDAPPTRGRRRT